MKTTNIYQQIKRKAVNKLSVFSVIIYMLKHQQILLFVVFLFVYASFVSSYTYVYVVHSCLVEMSPVQNNGNSIIQSEMGDTLPMGARRTFWLDISVCCVQFATLFFAPLFLCMYNTEKHAKFKRQPFLLIPTFLPLFCYSLYSFFLRFIPSALFISLYLLLQRTQRRLCI